MHATSCCPFASCYVFLRLDFLDFVGDFRDVNYEIVDGLVCANFRMCFLSAAAIGSDLKSKDKTANLKT